MGRRQTSSPSGSMEKMSNNMSEKEIRLEIEKRHLEIIIRLHAEVAELRAYLADFQKSYDDD